MKIKCVQCNKDIKIYPYQKGKTKYCSRVCWSSSCKKNRIEKTCAMCSKSFAVYPSLVRVKYCSMSCKARSMEGLGYWKGRKRQNMTGEYNPAWKGGVTPKNKLVRHSPEYRSWRTSVFTRDNYTCVVCGKRGITLQADHVKPFAFYPELRMATSNGRTLCVSCHKQTVTYKRRVDVTC